MPGFWSTGKLFSIWFTTLTGQILYTQFYFRIKLFKLNNTSATILLSSIFLHLALSSPSHPFILFILPFLYLSTYLNPYFIISLSPYLPFSLNLIITNFLYSLISSPFYCLFFLFFLLIRFHTLSCYTSYIVSIPHFFSLTFISFLFLPIHFVICLLFLAYFIQSLVLSISLFSQSLLLFLCVLPMFWPSQCYFIIP